MSETTIEGWPRPPHPRACIIARIVETNAYAGFTEREMRNAMHDLIDRNLNAHGRAVIEEAFSVGIEGRRAIEAILKRALDTTDPSKLNDMWRDACGRLSDLQYNTEFVIVRGGLKLRPYVYTESQVKEAKAAGEDALRCFSHHHRL